MSVHFELTGDEKYDSYLHLLEENMLHGEMEDGKTSALKGFIKMTHGTVKRLRKELEGQVGLTQDLRFKFLKELNSLRKLVDSKWKMREKFEYLEIRFFEALQGIDKADRR